MTNPASTPAGSIARERASDPEAPCQWGLLARLRRLPTASIVLLTCLGALSFAAQQCVTSTVEERIEVSTAKQRELIEQFEQRVGRAPIEAERAELVERFVEEEALLREGLRLSLVHTDPTLRAQLIARVRSFLRNEVELPPATESDLQRYYDEHRADYAAPESVQYREYWIQRGPEAGAKAERLMGALRAGDEPEQPSPPADDHAGRTEAELTALYDGQVARAILTLPNGTWHELRSERGIHIVRVERHTPASQPPFSLVRERVDRAYLEDQAARAWRAELERLTSRWRVTVGEAP